MVCFFRKFLFMLLFLSYHYFILLVPKFFKNWRQSCYVALVGLEIVMACSAGIKCFTIPDPYCVTSQSTLSTSPALHCILSMCMFSCIHVCVCARVCMCGQRACVFLTHSSLCLLRQGLSLGPELTDLAKLASQK